MSPAFESLNAAMAAQQAYMAGLPQWVQLWVSWMTFAMLSGLWFLGERRETRMVLLVAVLTGVCSMAIGYYFGWSRLWGLVHVVLWTPLLVWLWRRRPAPGLGAYSLWVWALMLTIAVSLVFDYIDVARYFSGDP